MRKYLSALAALVALSSLAYALTAPPTVDTRRVPWQTTTHYRFTVNWNDGNIANGVKIGALPAKSFVNAVQCHVSTAFNAGTLNYLGVATTQAGTALGVGDWVNGSTGTTSSCVLTSATYQSLTTAAGLGLAVTTSGSATPTGTSGGWDVWVRYYQTGTAATAGQTTVVLTYTPDDDM